MKMKVVEVAGKDRDSLSKSDLERVERSIDPDMFAYSYKVGDWEGSGFAIWKIGDEFGYSYLGHCSCNGPTDDLNSIMYSLEDVKKIASKNQYGQEVVEILENWLR